MTPEREQLEFMLCQALDAAGHADMPVELRVWMTTQAGAAAMKEYARLKEILKTWRIVPANIDFAANTERISQAIAGARESRSLADLVPHWSGPVPQVDYAALKSRISSAVLRESTSISRRELKAAVQRRRVVAWMGRIAAPLAVAAAIALALWWPREIVQEGHDQIARNPKDKRHPMVVATVDTPKDSGKVKIRFDETVAKPKDALADEDPGMAVSGSDDEDRPSDDDAFLY